MDADWSVELGAEDETLEFPWFADETLRWIDLKQHPELAGSLSEATEFPEISAALLNLNPSDSPLQTAKCDVWFEDQLGPAEDVYGADWRLSSYIDIVFMDVRRFSFEAHENFVKSAAKLASGTTEVHGAVEFVVRRCYFRQDAGSDCLKGFYVTFYVSGYGTTRDEARSRWASALSVATGCAGRAAPQA